MSSPDSSSKRNRSHQLVVYFSEEERELLRQISARDGREEGPEVKWLVREYAAGKLRSANFIQSVVGESAEGLQEQLRQISERIESMKTYLAHGPVQMPRAKGQANDSLPTAQAPAESPDDDVPAPVRILGGRRVGRSESSSEADKETKRRKSAQ